MNLSASHFLRLLLLLAACCGCSRTAAEDDRADAQRASSREEKPDSATAADDSPVEVPDLGTRKTGVDWPSFLGSARNSKSPETGISSPWPEAGPPIVWQKPLGTGYDIGSISRGRYVQFDRFDDQAVVYCLNAETGEELWSYPYTTYYEDMYGYNNGPRCSPVIDGDRVYAYGVDGVLLCLRLTDGELLWKVDTAEKYGVVQNFFGVGSTPLVAGELLLVMVGGSPRESPGILSGRTEPNGTAVVAFDKLTGKEEYRVGDDLASYSSPIAATIDRRRYGFAFCRGGLLAFDPAGGEQLFHYPWRARVIESVNAATPIVIGDRVFITETYGPGSSMLRIEGDSYELVWKDEPRSRQKSMQAHWNTPIHVDGYIYASSGRHQGNAELRCIRASDGKVMWSEPGLTRSSLLHVDGHFVCLSENGVLRLLKVNPEKYDVVSEVMLRAAAPEGEFRLPEELRLLKPPAWAAPILSHGLLYVRGRDRLVCLELIPEE